MARSSSDRVVAGVCAGVAHHLGLPVRATRIAAAALAVAGVGVPMYLLLWAFAPVDTEEGVPTGPGRPVVRLHGPQALLLVGVGLVAVGLATMGPLPGLDLGLGWFVPVVAILLGAVVAWSQLDEPEDDQAGRSSPVRRALVVARPALGLALVVGGVVAVTAQGGTLGDGLRAAVSALVVLVGAAVIASPWVIRLWRRLQREQTERARATERAEVAAHLHDSVLQTLALIQRTSDDPAAVARLARSQERELRGWLYGAGRSGSATLGAAVRGAVEEVEDLHGIRIDLVLTGDRPIDEQGEALVGALREALLNAVRHGAAPVSVYVEVSPSGVEAFVRDRGPGFDLDTVATDRLGVRESILGRMARHGGTASVRRLDDGTEVALGLPAPQPIPTAEVPA
jgi:signal transduction histidine kinase/phage shock protein PspC (stress-responsive transcriptional regulator)